MNAKFAVAVLPLLVMSGVSDAGTPPPAYPYAPTIVGGGSNIDNKAYAGLKLELPSMAPSLVAGVRRVRTQADGDTQGGDLSMAVSFAGGAPKPGKLRLKGFIGQNRYQAEAGGGYNFATPGMFVGAGVNAPYVNMGADWQSGGLAPFIMLDTLGKAKKPVGTPTCTVNPGDVYNSATGQCDAGAP